MREQESPAPQLLQPPFSVRLVARISKPARPRMRRFRRTGPSGSPPHTPLPHLCVSRAFFVQASSGRAPGPEIRQIEIASQSKVQHGGAPVVSWGQNGSKNWQGRASMIIMWGPLLPDFSAYPRAARECAMRFMNLGHERTYERARCAAPKKIGHKPVLRMSQCPFDASPSSPLSRPDGGAGRGAQSQARKERGIEMRGCISVALGLTS